MVVQGGDGGGIGSGGMVEEVDLEVKVDKALAGHGRGGGKVVGRWRWRWWSRRLAKRRWMQG